MDAREKTIRDRIVALERDIAAKQLELGRLQTALEVWLEITPADAQPDNKRFAGKKFLECVRIVLADGKSKSTAAIYEALVTGGFTSESANFRGVVSNMLNEASSNHQLVKTGARKAAMWSLPTPASPRA